MTQLLFDFAIEPPAKIYIQRNKDQPVECWEYEDVLGVNKMANYVVITMKELSAFVPMPWVVGAENL